MIAPALRPILNDWKREPRTGHLLRRYDAADGTDGAGYDVAVALPVGDPPPAGFALLLVLDAALHFDAAAAAAAALARRTAKTGVAGTIVAGIASGANWTHDAARRERDLVPEGNAAERFAALIAGRILPDIRAAAAVDPAATGIFGHSLGGLCALAALAGEGASFAAAIAVSPSFWRLPELPGRLSPLLGGRRVLIGSGGREPAKITDALAAAEALLARSATVTRLVLPDEDHGSVPFALLPAALRFLHAASSQEFS